MTAKEKADQLIIKFLTASFGTMEEYVPVPKEFAKQCALIAVDEILKAIKWYEDFNNEKRTYWQEVKTHINS